VQRFHVENFGCRATQADGAAIERELLKTGFRRAIQPSDAEVVVLNTCTVTSAADRDARAAIRRIHRRNPECKILVTGCYAQRAPEEITALPGVSWVVGNSHKHQVASCVTELFSSVPSAGTFIPLQSLLTANSEQTAGHGRILLGDIFAHTQLLAAPVFDAALASEKTRPNLKVQDGCDNRCSFCIIPSVRGQSRSLPLADVLRDVEALVAAGHRELVLSGINLGRWGRDLSHLQFEDLVRAILNGTALQKLRLSSVEA